MLTEDDLKRPDGTPLPLERQVECWKSEAKGWYDQYQRLHEQFCATVKDRDEILDKMDRLMPHIERIELELALKRVYRPGDWSVEVE